MLAIVVIREGHRVIKKFPDESIGKKFFKVAIERFGPENTFLVSCSKAIAPPPDYHPSSGLLWCPHCGAKRKYVWYPRWENYICPICNISTADFYVKKYNHLWGHDSRKNPAATKGEKKASKKEKKPRESKPKLLKRNLLRRKLNG